MTRPLAAALLLWCFLQPASAGVISPPDVIADIIIRVDWQYPQQLPPRFRNHCRYEYFTARPYCSDHCGGDYQFYYCSEASFGCCHLGRGYCGWTGALRCSP
jgi:hypothetical protein